MTLNDTLLSRDMAYALAGNRRNMAPASEHAARKT